jgi:RNA polymerase sigma factor (TIGR02999 family)
VRAVSATPMIPNGGNAKVNTRLTLSCSPLNRCGGRGVASVAVPRAFASSRAVQRPISAKVQGRGTNIGGPVYEPSFEGAETQVLIGRWKAGEDGARDRLLDRLHPELSQIAAARLRGERDTSLSTGDLINDAVVRLIQDERIDVNDRAHLIALASRMMRNILVDHARLRMTDKRRHQKVELCTNVEGAQRFDLNSLDAALIRLRAIDAELSDLVEMRYFGGMTVEDVADVTGKSRATINRRWATARAWLADAMMNPIDHD